MNEENKKSKKKILTYYLILGISILVIAAITVSVIFAVNGNRTDIIDGGFNSDDTTDGSNDGTTDDVNADDNTGDTDNHPDDKGDEPVDSSTKYEFVAPIVNVDVINGYTFYCNKTLDCYHFHSGLDFAGEEGANVLACIDGTVESITTGDLLDGNVITLVHENGIKTKYSFIDVKDNLKVGDKVVRGDVIGTIAKPTGSEHKEGAHLHFEVLKDGKLADPEQYLDIDAK